MSIGHFRATMSLGRRDGLGRFSLDAITACNPFTHEAQPLFNPESRLINVPTLHVDWLDLLAAVADFPNGSTLTLRFHTPTYLKEKGQLFKQPDFGVFFRRLLFRIDELNRQFADAPRREREEVAQLSALADRVRLVESQTRWHDLWSHSSRKNERSPISGFVGRATYMTDDWRPLLPWLLWGQGTHAGKSAAKGNGVYQIEGPSCYWDWLAPEVELFANRP